MGNSDSVQVWGEIWFGQVGGFSTRQALDSEQRIQLLKQIIPGHPHNKEIARDWQIYLQPKASVFHTSSLNTRLWTAREGREHSQGLALTGWRLIPVSENSGKPCVGFHPVQPPQRNNLYADALTFYLHSLISRSHITTRQGSCYSGRSFLSTELE